MPHFSHRLLNWFKQYGRIDLPWQHDPSPYRVWVSEIMLQQTQVNTVIPYYNRFMQSFPTLPALASAPLDAVLHHWTGLGYYARARHLHQAAQIVGTEYHGQVPLDLAELMQLPGIGRSTAGAILALSCGQRHPILDGNVKRVLCRYHAINHWPGESAITNMLWQLAEQHTPTERVAAYTQAMMDLGATVCTRTRPLCSFCPVNQDCAAYQQGQPSHYPLPKPRKALPRKQLIFIMVQTPTKQVLLQQRPQKGIWGGLWSFPECADMSHIAPWFDEYLKIQPDYLVWTPLRHTFTHFHLEITPVHVHLPQDIPIPITLPESLWCDLSSPPVCGFAAPVVRLLNQLNDFTTGERIPWLASSNASNLAKKQKG